MYLVTSMAFFVAGGLMAMLMRGELGQLLTRREDREGTRTLGALPVRHVARAGLVPALPTVGKE